MGTIKAIFFLAVFAVLVAAGIVYLGIVNVAADIPDASLVHDILQIVRQRSVSAHAANVIVPSLDDPQLIAKGAEHYREMCTGCHLAPGITSSEMRAGLNPQPPDLTKVVRATPAELFWTIKHGIKMTAMPAWGPTHSDELIWGMVAFVRKLPEMTPAQYDAMTQSSSGSEGHDHQHAGP